MHDPVSGASQNFSFGSLRAYTQLITYDTLTNLPNGWNSCFEHLITFPLFLPQTPKKTANIAEILSGEILKVSL